jgi:hypothetical protein
MRKAIPERPLPTSDDSMVVANRAVPVNAVVLVPGRIGHYNSLSALVVRPASATNSGWIIEMCRCIYNDTGEVLRQESCSRGHIGERAGGREIVAQINDPTIDHSVISTNRPSDHSRAIAGYWQCAWERHIPRK